MLGEEEGERGDHVNPGDPGAQQDHRWSDSGGMRGSHRVSSSEGHQSDIPL